MTFILRGWLLGLSIVVFGNWSIADDRNYVLPVAPNELKVMAYNVENLFDTEHDTNKRDRDFLPVDHPEKEGCGRVESCRTLDWTPEKLGWKFERIAQAVAGQGVLPDMLILLEVENDPVVSALAAYLGYEYYVMTNSPDIRGIDTAILFNEEKFSYLDYFEIEVPGTVTRNISAMTVALKPELGGGVLVVSPNHWPSQIGSNSNEMRIRVAATLRAFTDDIRHHYREYKTHYLFAGDFNSLESEKPHPIYDVLMYDWNLNLHDLRQFAIAANSPMIPLMPPASYYYTREKTWNDFDRILFDHSLADGSGLEIDPYSYRIHAPSYLVYTNQAGVQYPYKYNHRTNNPESTGYSDHYAIVAKLRYQ